MFVTLYCDASFCSTYSVGGWAVWIRSEKGRIIRSGITPPYCVHSGEAELVAIYAGIFLATQTWPETKTLLVRSDSTEALGLVSGIRAPKKDADIRLLSKIDRIRADTSLRIIPRWVKGHRAPRSTDAYLNDKVDEMAKKAMRQQRILREKSKKTSA